MASGSPLLRMAGVVAALSVLVAGSVVVLSPVASRAVDAVDATPPEVDVDQLGDFATRSYVFADDGSVLATLFGPENRQPVPLDLVPETVVAPILAVEDAEFWDHGGVNVAAIARALVSNVDAGGVRQGGSTITQQLVKNALLDSDTTFNRKIREAALALEVERQLSKEEILETYLNTVYFGAGAYGVQAAAETYFGVGVEWLGWAEGALLAGMIANPSLYDPFTQPDAAIRQRRIALDRLVEVGTLSQGEADVLATAPLPADRCATETDIVLPQCQPDQVAPSTGNYFVEDVRQQLLTDPVYGLGGTPQERADRLYGGGLRITTTLDPNLQRVAEDAVARVVPANDLGVTAAMVSVENETGAVRAMVGGPGYDEYRYNVTTQLPGRQTGSSFKTFVLLTALGLGAVPDDTVQGGGSFPNPGGTPNPYNMPGAGGSLTFVTANSSNGAYIRLGQIVGLEEVGETAERLGLRTDFGGYPISLPLGTLLTPPIDMASAFSAIANGGVRNPWYLIERVEDAAGNVLYEHQSRPVRALTAQTACLATQVLTEVVRSGTATRARLPNQVAAGKTGTTDRNADAWFTGFTPYLTTSVWMGNPDENVSMANIGGVANFGGTFPAAVWREFNVAYHENLEPRSFPRCGPTRPGGEITSSDQLATLGLTPSTTEPEDPDASSTTVRRPTTSWTPITLRTTTTTRPTPTTNPPSSTSTSGPTTTTTDGTGGTDGVGGTVEPDGPGGTGAVP
jgi:membrane peptidoglycan carboxypeptidase